MTKLSIIASAAVLPAISGMTTSASAFQTIKTFQNARVIVQNVNAMIPTIANSFCTVCGFDNASTYDLARYTTPTLGTAGLALFCTVSCRSSIAMSATGVFIP